MRRDTVKRRQATSGIRLQWRTIREAIELHVTGMREDGLPVPEPSSQVEYIEVTA